VCRTGIRRVTDDRYSGETAAADLAPSLDRG
jgi:hypothetical protein